MKNIKTKIKLKANPQGSAYICPMFPSSVIPENPLKRSIGHFNLLLESGKVKNARNKQKKPFNTYREGQAETRYYRKYFQYCRSRKYS